MIAVNLLSQVRSGYGSVGIVVASDTRGPRFESSHWQNLLNIYLLSTVLKRQKLRNRGREWPIFFKKNQTFSATYAFD